MPGNLILMPALGRDCVFKVLGIRMADSGFGDGPDSSGRHMPMPVMSVTLRTRVQLLGPDEEWVVVSVAEEGGNSVAALDAGPSRIAAASTAAAEAVGGACSACLSPFPPPLVSWKWVILISDLILNGASSKLQSWGINSDECIDIDDPTFR